MQENIVSGGRCFSLGKREDGGLRVVAEMMVPSQRTLMGGVLPPNLKNPSKDLTPAQRKIYNYLRRLGPLTEKQISIQPAFHDISDVGRALRKMREHKDPIGRPIYVESYSQRNGPQLWEARP